MKAELLVCLLLVPHGCSLHRYNGYKTLRRKYVRCCYDNRDIVITDKSDLDNGPKILFINKRIMLKQLILLQTITLGF